MDDWHFLVGSINQWIDSTFPALLTNHLHKSGFPTSWHVFVNRIGLAQTVLALFGCLLHQRYLPSIKPRSSFLIKQFYGVLGLHSLLYIGELLFTSIWSKYTTSALHHVFALAIFAVFWLEPNVLSCLSILPFVFHHLYWVDWEQRLDTLKAYNLCFIVCGLVGLYVFRTSRRRIASYALPALSILEVGINYLTYCFSFGGSMCPTGSVLPRIIETSLISVSLMTLVTLGVLALAERRRNQMALYIPLQLLPETKN